MIGQDWGFHWGLPEAISSYAGEIDFLIRLLHWVMAGLFLGGVGLFAYCLVRFRSRGGRRAAYASPGERYAFVPAAIIFVFEIWLIVAYETRIWGAIKGETPPPQESVVVHLVAQQFAWNFQYAGPDGRFGRRAADLVSAANPIGLDPADPASRDDIVTINNLHVPVGKPTILQMTSKDVIHDFQVVGVRNKQDIVPGMRTTLWFEPVKTGKFEIGCAQLCGLGHTQMVGNVLVETPQEFAVWQKAELAEKGIVADGGDVLPGAGAAS